ncbi:ABC transporter ATP-binding protein [[Clostridium] polysaccharolyticum]|uniref:ABC-2 type transport system ATP-binding protein n=1 Tax=[Clostridium] polysaccharolyticum TaxID=29364 RepID=A0A1I0DYL4_9FIRM|nr:ATP-binding cassette domain-containing protein [[Clostridium] polysaccharolyticum]SET37654.1 ABC-2 type transport system ATP-binding protein [[Clostridium] polysaccharolyticum]
MKKVDVRNIVKSFNGKCVVNHVNLSFSSGKMTALCGKNGSGKTTTIRCILGILEKDDGEIIVDGKESTIDKKRIGYIPEERGMFVKEKVETQLRFFAQLKGMEKEKIDPAMNYWLKRFHIEEYKYKRLESMSKGNQQKVQLISALIHDPEIIILDEPFSGLDPINMDLFIDVMRELKAANKCILISSHQLTLLEGICEDICIIEKGQCMYEGSILELIKTHSKDYMYIKTKDKASLNDYEEISPNHFRKMLNSSSEFNSEIEKIAQKNLEIDSIGRGKTSLQEIFVSLVNSVEEK